MFRSNSFLIFILLCCLSLHAPDASAQKLEVGAGLGAMNYTGDISNGFRLRNFRPAGDLFLRYNLKNGFTFRAEVSGGGFAASDLDAKNEFQRLRERSFRTIAFEGSLLTEYNFLDYTESKNALNWTPYVFGGLGYTFFKPRPNDGNYRTSTMVIPFGVGVKYQIKRPWSIGAEFGARKTFTDYLDNFGGEEIMSDKYENGNPGLKDIYYFLGVSVSYTFYKIVCP